MTEPSPEAQRLQAQALQRGAIAVAQDGAAAAIVYVARDGRLSLACSCGEGLYHPTGRVKYTLDRLTAHLELHATAAAHGVPWAEVELRRQRLRPNP